MEKASPIDPKLLVQVRITNRNDFDIVDRFAAKRYVFPAPTYDANDTDKKNPRLKTVQVSPEVAAHIFGWKAWDGCTTDEENDRMMLVYAAKRHGWNRIALDNDPEGTELKLARERFSKIDIVPIRFKVVEQEEDEIEELARKKA